MAITSIGSLDALNAALRVGNSGAVSNILGSNQTTSSFESILSNAMSGLTDSQSNDDNSLSLINAIEGSGSTSSASNNFSGNKISFEDIVKGAIDNVKATDLATQIDAINVANGTQDDLHTVTMNLAKADLAVSQLVQVRNKALEAYNEIMRITL